MRLMARCLQVVAALFFFAPLGVTGDVRGADRSRPLMLVATSRLEESAYEQTVVVAVPLPQGGHIGFIINRPTSVKLETLFPDQAAFRQVVDPVYLVGPGLSNAVFALTRKAPDESGSIIPITPGLFAVLDGTAVDRVIETTPRSARFFVGAILWTSGELDEQIQRGAWDVRITNAEVVFRADAADLWDELQTTPAPELMVTWA